MRREGSATADYDDSGWIVPPSEGGAAMFVSDDDGDDGDDVRAVDDESVGESTLTIEDAGEVIIPHTLESFAQSAVAAAAAAAIAVVVHESSQLGSESNSQANDNLDNPAVSKCPVCFRVRI